MTDLKIAVIDVETPNGNNDSICSIGITVIENNNVTEEKYFLVNPETNFDYRCIKIHGISEKDVADAFTFPELWERIKVYFSGYLLAGHNFTFDLSCINKSLKKYNIDVSPSYYIDTYTIAKENVTNTNDYKLTTLCNTFNIELKNHHNSLDDCRATANLLKELMSKYEIDIDNYIKQYPFKGKTIKKSKRTYSDTTRSLQELQGILFGITCDGILSDDEIYAIQKWATNHKELKGNFPYDKIYSAIEDVLEDNIITEDERDYLFSLFNNILNPVESDNLTEEISLKGAIICLTGDFECMSKNDFEITLSSRGAIVKKNVVKDLNYLVVGNKGSQQWSQGNYGNKVKKAMQYNEKGCNIQIIPETDFLISIGY